MSCFVKGGVDAHGGDSGMWDNHIKSHRFTPQSLLYFFSCSSFAPCDRRTVTQTHITPITSHHDFVIEVLWCTQLSKWVNWLISESSIRTGFEGCCPEPVCLALSIFHPVCKTASLPEGHPPAFLLFMWYAANLTVFQHNLTFSSSSLKQDCCDQHKVGLTSQGFLSLAHAPCLCRLCKPWGYFQFLLKSPDECEKHSTHSEQE